MLLTLVILATLPTLLTLIVAGEEGERVERLLNRRIEFLALSVKEAGLLSVVFPPFCTTSEDGSTDIKDVSGSLLRRLPNPFDDDDGADSDDEEESGRGGEHEEEELIFCSAPV